MSVSERRRYSPGVCIIRVMSDRSDEEAPASEGGQCNYLAVQFKVNVYRLTDIGRIKMD